MGCVDGCASTGGSVGEPVGHRGGRLIWQLADANRLLVAWHVVTWDETARDYERRLLALRRLARRSPAVRQPDRVTPRALFHAAEPSSSA